MNLVDSSGWLEYFTGGRNAKSFAAAIEDTNSLVVSSINLYEVFKKTLKERGEESAVRALALMHQAKVIEVNSTIAVNAARLSLELKVSMADSIIIATGRSVDATIWTQDSDFKGIDGVRYFAKNL